MKVVKLSKNLAYFVNSGCISLENNQLATADGSTIWVFSNLSTSTTIIYNKIIKTVHMDRGTCQFCIHFRNMQILWRSGLISMKICQSLNFSYWCTSSELTGRCGSFTCWCELQTSNIVRSNQICPSSVSARSFKMWWNLLTK